jgi:hypothetical protein
VFHRHSERRYTAVSTSSSRHIIASDLVEIFRRTRRCATEPLNPAARFSTKCGAALPSNSPRKVIRAFRALALLSIVVGRP